MSIFEETTNDEALARALQEEFDTEELASKPSNKKQLKPGTIIYTNVISGPSVRPKRKRGTHTQGLLQGGLAEFENADLDVQAAVAEIEDEESEDYENTYHQVEEFENDEINDCVAKEDLVIRQSTLEEKKLEEDLKNESTEEESEEEEEVDGKKLFKAKKRREKFEKKIKEAELKREKNSTQIRLTMIRNTNVKEQKMKMVNMPDNLKELLSIGLEIF